MSAHDRRRRAALFAALALALAGGCGDAPPAAPYCGDGVVGPGEACDDGNLSSADDCLPTCVPATCGDHAVRRMAAAPADREACDSGGVDGCACDADCSPAVCGDGYRNAAAGEVCDDGNTASADGCRGDCRSDETCGNGVVDRQLPRNPLTDPATCLDARAQGTRCAEVCDDGNRVSGDGCSENCLSDERCGNGVLDRSGDGGANPPETCDDGNRRDGDGCPGSCQIDGDGAACGDGVVGPDQECDGGGVQTAWCDFDPTAPGAPQNCTFARCGDGHRNPAAGEACDDGNDALDDDCVGCRVAVCGDGATDRTPPRVEDCDLGAQNGLPGAPCSATCTLTP